MSLGVRLMWWTSAILFLLSITNVFSYILEDSNEQNDDDVKNVLTRNIKSVALLKTIIDGMDGNLDRVYKRGCNFNLPGFDCDNSKMIHTGSDSAWWRRGMTPGRKRSGCINADGSACEAGQIVQEMNNRKPWMNGPGRRK